MRAPLRSCEPFGKPPTTRTRHCAPIAAASSTARRLSSSAARRGGSSAAGGKPPPAGPGAGAALGRVGLPGGALPPGWAAARPGGGRGEAGAGAALDELLQRPRLHRHRVDRDERAIVREVAHYASSSLLGFVPACVTRGPDPRVHLLRKKMDRIATRACPSCAVLCAASR